MNQLQLTAAQEERLWYLLHQAREAISTFDELAELESLIVEYAHARRMAARYIHQHAGLLWTSRPYLQATSFISTATAGSEAVGPGATGSEAMAARRPKPGSQFFHRPRMLSIVAAMAAVLLMLATMAYLRGPAVRMAVRPSLDASVPALGEDAAHLVAVASARWSDGQKRGTGTKLRAGESLHLKEGLAEIHFESGACALLEGPAIFTVKDENRCRLDFGRMVARVQGQATGFTVETPRGRVVDLGTEFGLSIDRAGTQEISVFEGAVQVCFNDSDAAAEKALDLSAGCGMRIEFPRGKLSITHIGSEEPRFVRNASGYAASNGWDPHASAWFLKRHAWRLETQRIDAASDIFFDAKHWIPAGLPFNPNGNIRETDRHLFVAATNGPIGGDGGLPYTLDLLDRGSLHISGGSVNFLTSYGHNRGIRRAPAVNVSGGHLTVGYFSLGTRVTLSGNGVVTVGTDADGIPLNNSKSPTGVIIDIVGPEALLQFTEWNPARLHEMQNPSRAPYSILSRIRVNGEPAVEGVNVAIAPFNGERGSQIRAIASPEGPSVNYGDSFNKK